jgi:putative selenate reductase
VFEISVGYDLAGLKSDPMSHFLAGLKDSQPLLEELLKEVPATFAPAAGEWVPEPIVKSATLSTFHGCPPGEIEAIAKYLIVEHELDVTVKLNPTLLGLDRVREILFEKLGYRELQLIPEAFAEDLSWDRALDLIRTLIDLTRSRGRTFGIKLTNTLVVGNHKGWLPGERIYLSGPPLHVLAIALLEDLHRSLPGMLKLGTRTEGVPVAFSAGVERGNFASVTGLGLVPVTVCTDLLKGGGYGRLTLMLRRLQKAMAEAGCRDIPSWVRHQETEARQKTHPDAVAAYAAELLGSAGSRKYGRAARRKVPKRVAAKLEMFDCCSCHLCVTVCPNDAMLRVETPEGLGGQLEQKSQYLCLAELCNACGNCTIFCPEQGEPYSVKPRLFIFPQRFAAEEGQAFLVLPAQEKVETATLGPEIEPASNQVPQTFILRATSVAQKAVSTVAALVNGPGGLPWRPGKFGERGNGGEGCDPA